VPKRLLVLHKLLSRIYSQIVYCKIVARPLDSTMRSFAQTFTIPSLRQVLRTSPWSTSQTGAAATFDAELPALF
jgi:hypothetical protein